MGGFGSRAPHPHSTPKSRPLLTSALLRIPSPPHPTPPTPPVLPWNPGSPWHSSETTGLIEFLYFIEESDVHSREEFAWCYAAGQEQSLECWARALCARTCTPVRCFSPNSQVLSSPTPSGPWFYQSTFSMSLSLFALSIIS